MLTSDRRSLRDTSEIILTDYNGYRTLIKTIHMGDEKGDIDVS